MSPYELLDLALSLNNRLDTHWTLFITVHLALIGGIIYVDRPLLKNEKVAAVIIYTGFAIVNYVMMTSQAQFLASIYTEVATLKDAECCQNNHVIEFVYGMTQLNVSEKLRTSIISAHIIMYIILVLSIIFDKALPKLEKKNAAKINKD